MLQRSMLLLVCNTYYL